MTILKKTIQFLLPFALGLGILQWMYRGTDWGAFFAMVRENMHWKWMLFSMIFGVLAQTIRARRWKMTLLAAGESPRNSTCDDAIYVSYAASLVVPRIGEVTRCGTLRRYDGVSFTKSLGTVFTERVVDSIVMILLTIVAFMLQIPKMLEFMSTTGMDFRTVLGRFTTTGYVVTLLCLLAALVAAAFFVRRYISRGRDLWHDLKTGILSLRNVNNIPLYLLMSFGISACYFLHFYVAFFSFDFTASISPLAAFLMFCVGMFAVLVPTPNGAGSWHFAVKTMLVLYGVGESDAIVFALVVHTLQTALVVVLGIWGWAHLTWGTSRQGKMTATATTQADSLHQ